MEPNELALALEHGAFQIIVEDGARDAPECRERGEVAAQEALGGLVEIEAGEERARPRQDHEKAGQCAPGMSDHDGAEAGPVDLCLLAGQDRQSQERLVLGGTGPRDEATDGKDRALVAAIAKHLVQPRRTQMGMLLEGDEDEVAVRVEHLRANAELGREERPALDGVMDGVAVQSELGGDGADLPVLGEEEATDLGALLARDHRATWSMSICLRSANCPMPVMSRRRARRPRAAAGIQSSV